MSIEDGMMGGYISDNIRVDDTAKDTEASDIGGFMCPPGLKIEMVEFARARIREFDRMFPGVKSDPLYIAMKEVADNWDDIMPGVELTWDVCGSMARHLMETRQNDPVRHIPEPGCGKRLTIPVVGSNPLEVPKL